MSDATTTTANTAAPVERPPLGAILPYFGQKRTMAPLLCDLLGIVEPGGGGVTQYVEPFHGSLAVLLEARARGYGRAAIACDTFGLLHNLVVNLASERRCSRILDRIATLPFDERTFRGCCEVVASDQASRRVNGVLVEDVSVELAATYLVASWMGRNGEAGLGRDWAKAQVAGFCCRFTESGGDPALRWARVKESIPVWWSLLCERTQFLDRCGIATLGSLTDSGTLAIYADPPYLAETRGGARYAQDFEDGTGGMFGADDDHARLAAALARLTEARVVVSYYEHPRLASLYPASEGWRIVGVPTNKATAQSGGGSTGAGDAPEVLVCRNAVAPEAVGVAMTTGGGS